MGDRFTRKRKGLGDRLMERRGKPPPEILAWGLGDAARVGHNNGPPLDDDAPGYVWRRYRWAKVHAEVWKTPPLGILKFRMARAEAAGLSYRDYMLAFLDTGRHPQARDRDMDRANAVTRIRAAWGETIACVAPESGRMARGLVLSSLIAAYDDASRHYHDLVHIGAMLSGLEAFEASPVEGPDALILAILFHDAIYDATRAENEEASARLARLHLTDLGVAADTIARVEALILATRHGGEVLADDPELALLVDLDLAILAAEPARYSAYASAIRREYAHVPDEKFRVGRAAVLAAFLARPNIYTTPELSARWEARARENLAVELATLTASSARR